MNKTDFKLFLKDISLGLFVILSILFLCNISGVFDNHEKSLKPKLLWRNLAKKNSVNTAQIIFVGNSQSHFLNPTIIDSITEKSSQFFGFNGASIKPLSWFFLNSWDYLNPELVVLETHSFKSIYAETNIDSIMYKRWENYVPRFSNSPFNFNDITPFNEKKSNFWDISNFNKSELRYLITGPAIVNHNLIDSEPGIIYRALFPDHNNAEDHLKGFRKNPHLPISDSLLNRYNNNWISFPDTRIETDILPTVESIIKECQSRGIKVLIYESPMYYKHFKPQIQRRKQIDSFCQKLNIPFVDLSLESSLIKNPNYFQNTEKQNQHLTPDGANAISNILANKMKKLFFSFRMN
jgi:hypothetical protein